MKLRKIVSLILTAIMLMSCVTVAWAAEPPASVHVSARNDAPQITIDGVISETEWGAPLGSWNRNDCWAGDKVVSSKWWHRWDYNQNGQDEAIAKEQRVSLYVRRDTTNVYVGIRLDKAFADTSLTDMAQIKNSARAIFTIGNYNAETNIDRGQYGSEIYEKYICYQFGLLNGTTKTHVITNKGAAINNLTADNYAIVYDSASKTYTYEVAIPYAGSNGYIDPNRELVMSLDVADAGGKSRFVIGYAANRILDNGALPNGTYHEPSNPLHITFDADYVGTTVAPMPANKPVLDGSVTEAEWGDPVIQTSPGHAYETWSNGYWNNEAYDYNQKAKVYLTNDADFIYMAVTLDHEKDTVAFTGSNHWVFPKIGFAIGAVNAAGTDIAQTEYQGNMYDTYNAWDLRFDAEGNPVIVVAGTQGTGDMYYSLSKDNAYAKYDPDTDTYTYEVRIPFNLTNIPNVHPNGYDKMALSLHISAGHYNTNLTGENNRYNIGGLGWASLSGKTPLSGKCLIMNLNPVTAEGTYVNTTASAGKEITVDGKISTAEWGAAVAVMSHKSENFFNDDKKNGSGDQRAKVYLSNDADYIYVGATLNRAEKGITYSGTDAWKYPLFLFSISAWDDTTTVKRVGGAEQYTKLQFNLGATASCTNMSSNIAQDLVMGVNDYKVVYDENTRTYTYEARIPISATNVDYTSSFDVAFSAQIGTTLYNNNTDANDRYNLAVGAINHPYQSNAYEGGRAVKITLNNVDVSNLGTYVSDTVAENTGNVAIDGNVSEAEWGKPVIVTSPSHAQGYWNPNGYWKNEPSKVDPLQRAKIYMTNDTQYLYVAATLNRSDLTVNTTTPSYGMPQFTIVVGKYDPITKMVRVNGQEQFSSYRIGWTQGGTIACSAGGNQMPAFTLSENDWEVKYDAASRTFFYELRIPLSTTNINIHEVSQFAASIQIGDNNYGTAGNENNRFNIGGTGVAYKHQANQEGKYPHANQDVLVMNLRQTYYVKDTVPNIPTSMAIDGKITVGEWGEPVIVTNPAHTRNNLGAFWDFDTAAMDQSQTVRIWMNNDFDYIYVGATVDKSDYESATTNAAGAPLNNYMRPHFGVDISQYDAANTVKQIEFEGNMYEQYTGFIIHLDDNGNEVISIRTQGFDPVPLPADSYAISYDAATRTYTYEMRIPYNMTNIDLDSNRKVAVSASVGTTYSGKGEQSNRYIIGMGITAAQGANNFGHKNACLPMTLNDAVIRITPYVKDQVEVADTPIVIDGTVTDTEWGEPIVLTNPKHTQSTWGAFWDFDKQAVDHQQAAKIYMRNDKNGIYVAATLDRSEYNTATKNANGQPLQDYMRPHFRFTYSKYDEQYGVEHIRFNGKNFEAYGGYVMYLDDNGTAQLKDLRQGMDAMAFDPANYAIKYDETTKTYTYEIFIPYEYTNINIYESREMAFSASIGTTYAGNGEQSNRYNITAGQAFCGGAENFAHQGNVLKLMLGDARIKVDTVVKDTVAPFSGKIDIDGYVSAEEWGEPMIVTTPDHSKATWGAFWDFDKASVVPYQTATIYATNDDQYIYIAATLNETDLDTAVDSRNYERAHLFIDIGRYDEETDLERIKVKGSMRERFVRYQMAFKGAEPRTTVTGMNFDRVSLNDDDWAIRYDAEARTYVYEIRIPYENTTLRYGNGNMMNMAFTMAQAQTGGKEANRYLIGGTGAAFGNKQADNFAHTGQSLNIKLNENPYAEAGKWIPPVAQNPDNGDMAILPIAILFTVTALACTTLVIFRKKVK